MNNAIELLKEYKSLAGKSDAKSIARKKEICKWLESHKSELPQKDAKEFMDMWLAEMEADVADIKQQALREQIGTDMYRLIPMQIVAKEYFGKSAAWLSQRLNGTRVRGKVYTLNEEQKHVFNDAMQDLSRKFGSFRLT